MWKNQTNSRSFEQNLSRTRVVKCQSGWDKLMVEKNRIIEEYKQAGRKSELQDVIRNLHNSFKTCKLTIPQDLCYLQG